MLTPDVLPDIGPDDLRARVLARSGALRRRRRVLQAAPVALVVMMLAAFVLADGGPGRRVRTVPPVDKAPSHVEENSSRVEGGGDGQAVAAGPTVPGAVGGGTAPKGVPVPGLPGTGSPSDRVADNGPPFPYTNDLVVFSGPETPAGSVYVMNSDGSGRRQIPLGQQTAIHPALSPSRNLVAYAAVAMVGTETRGIYVAGLDGGGITLVATAPRQHVEHVRWMPDGSSLVFSTWGQPTGSNSFVPDQSDIYRVTLDGQLTLLARGWAPSPSPDGSLIAFRPYGDEDGPWVMNADGSGARKLVDSDVTASGYAWSPDGRTLAFTEGEASDEEPPRLTLLDLASGRKRAILPDAAGASWSPDGKAFVFSRSTDGQKCTPVVGCSPVTYHRIWTARLDGSGARVLTVDELADDWEPQFPAHRLVSR